MLPQEKKFLEFVKAQGGDITGLKISDKTIDVKSTKSGTVKKNLRNFTR